MPESPAKRDNHPQSFYEFGNERVASSGRTGSRQGRGGSGGLCALILLAARFVSEAAEGLADPEIRRAAGAALGARLRHGLRPEDRLRMRSGGEGFDFLIAAAADQEGAQALGERMRKRLSGPLALKDARLAPEIGMGWAALPLPAAEEVEPPWREALAQARERLRKDLRRADSAVERLLRRALAEDALTLAFQPLLDLRSGRIAKAEALLRLTLPQAPGPAVFVPAAERHGLIGELGAAAFRRAAEAAARWSRVAPLAPDSFRLGVNVAPRQLEAENFVETALKICAEAGCAPNLLTLEITESTALEAPAEAARRLEKLRAAGFRIALDDFGAAHSDLDRLAALPADFLKADALLVERAASGAQGARLLASVGALARSLGMKTVGEGVRSLAHLEAVRAADLDYAQGHLIGPPLEEAEWLKALGASWPPPELKPPDGEAETEEPPRDQ